MPIGQEVPQVARQDAAQAAVAMLDRSDPICAVNKAWIDFGVASGVSRPLAGSGGPNFLQVCEGGWFQSDAPD